MTSAPQSIHPIAEPVRRLVDRDSVLLALTILMLPDHDYLFEKVQDAIEALPDRSARVEELEKQLAEWARLGTIEASKESQRRANRIGELETALAAMMDTFKPFTSRPMGAPNSEARLRQEHETGVYAAARVALAGSALTTGQPK